MSANSGDVLTEGRFVGDLIFFTIRSVNQITNKKFRTSGGFAEDASKRPLYLVPSFLRRRT